MGNKPSITPVTDAVSDAFLRRRFAGSFRSGSHSVELDTLLNETNAFREDDDMKVSQRGGISTRRSKRTTGQVCFLFQDNECKWANCRYRHVCSTCSSPSHGKVDCPKHGGSADRQRGSHQLGGTVDRSDKPPHPRSRRDRARKGDKEPH